ncbi:MAG: polysaccharide pyruvyl transferase family protein [Elusimicrobia bacterium]|nr:polysaccharide pyruvyl transferase family protein [Candidatus Obscuribacterium magneticum]
MKFLVAGYYGFGNLGDELILRCLTDQLNKRFPNSPVTVLSAHPSKTTKWHGLEAVNRWNPLAVIWRIFKADRFILGGGGLFQDTTSARSLIYYLSLLETALLCRTPVFIYAVGVESIRRNFLKHWLRRLLNDPLVTLTVRDRESKETLSSLGVRESRLRVTADPVFSLSLPPHPTDNNGKEANILIIPRFPCPPSGPDVFAHIMDHVKKAGSYRMDGMLFHPQKEKSQWGLFHAWDEMNWEEIFRKFTDANYVISARYHALVLAVLAGKPFLGVGDPHKAGRLCTQMGMPFLLWEAKGPAIDKAIGELFKRTTEPKIDATAWGDAAEQLAGFVS